MDYSLNCMLFFGEKNNMHPCETPATRQNCFLLARTPSLTGHSGGKVAADYQYWWWGFQVTSCQKTKQTNEKKSRTVTLSRPATSQVLLIRNKISEKHDSYSLTLATWIWITELCFWCDGHKAVFCFLLNVFWLFFHSFRYFDNAIKQMANTFLPDILLYVTRIVERKKDPGLFFFFLNFRSILREYDQVFLFLLDTHSPTNLLNEIL